jgi:hypothetical protein
MRILIEKQVSRNYVNITMEEMAEHYTKNAKNYRKTLQGVGKLMYEHKGGHSDMTPADLTEWKNVGLCPRIGGAENGADETDGMNGADGSGGTLVFKCVKPATLEDVTSEYLKAENNSRYHVPIKEGDYLGMLDAPYEAGRRYHYPLAMACAGPIGALKSYGYKHGGRMYFAAISADQVFNDGNAKYVHERLDGAFYVPAGTVMSIYRVDSYTMRFGSEVDITYTLVEGVDTMCLIGG